MKFLICGDTAIIDVKEQIEKNDIKTLFNDVAEVLKSGDRVIANIECALTDSDSAIKKLGPNLKTSVKCAEILKEVGITDCSISNNHVFDYGVQGIKDTIEAFERNGLNYTGFGKNSEDARKDLIIEKDSKRIAVIAVCEHEYCYSIENRMGTRAFDPYDTMDDIVKAKSENDFVIVLYHGGKEQSVYPSPRLRKLCQSMVKHGADAVFCQHSHCIGCYEEFNGGHILYGQGNFHFIEEGEEHPHWQNGLIVKLDIDSKIDIDFIPVVVRKKGIELAKDNEYEKIMQTLKKQSDDLHNGNWILGWREFCEENKEWYISAIKNAYVNDKGEFAKELFDHYLRCEAHKDVWDELCKLSWEKDKSLY